MKNNALRAPLIKSAVLLAVLSLIIYLTISSPEGSIWSSLQAIFYTVFKAAQLGVGLILALGLCFIVLGGIFFGCVAMISTDNAKKMYNDLLQYVSDKAGSMKSLIQIDGKLGSRGNSRGFPASLNKNLAGLQASVKNLEQSWRAMDERIGALLSRVEQIEQDESITKLSDWLRKEEEKTEGVQESLAQFDQQLQQMKEQSSLSVGAMQKVTGRTEVLENQNSEAFSTVSSLEKRIEALASKLESVQPVHEKGEKKQVEGALEQKNNIEPRLFSYVENPKDKEKLQQIVTETMQEEMTYAQVIEHLSKNVGKKTAKVLAEHPSLTKEFIRECRRNK